MVTSYATIAKVRSQVGLRPEREWREDIGDGDGTKVLYELGYAGVKKKHYVVSRDQLGTVAIADVDVYLNDSTTRESSGYTLDETEGTITFTSAPTDGYNVQCTYWHSLLSDDEIEDECIPWAMDQIDMITNQSYYTSGDTYETTTDTWDGDGETDSFRLSKGRITAVNSYTIDSATTGFTENTDYYLYPKAHRIVFETPPSNDRKNVSITYSYGTEINETVKELATCLAALKAIRLSVGRTGLTGLVTGTGAKRGYKDSNRFVTQTKLLQESIARNFQYLGCKINIDSI